MNRTKIEWTDWTWNVQSGCKNGCNYCYARKMAQRMRGRCGYPQDDPFAPTFHPGRLNEPTKVSGKFRGVNPNMPEGSAMIFTCSMGDIAFAKEEDVGKIFEVIGNTPHNYQILTKKPQMLRFNFPRSAWPSNLTLGVSINKQEDAWRIWELMKHKVNNPEYSKAFRPGDWKTMLSIEPLQEFIDLYEIPEAKHLDWIVVGAETGNRKEKILPKKEWIESIVYYGNEHGIPVFLKDNLKPYYPFKLYQEFPTETT